MANKRKICVITGSRADYGLLYWAMKEVELDDSLELQIIVTGMHLSPEYGLTYQQIEIDGFSINKSIDMKLSLDTEVGICTSMGIAMSGFSRAYTELKPELLVVLGDRFEIFSAVTAATISRIPVVHLHGGEKTEGAFDEAMRHAITKMSHIHFTSTEEYRNRVIQLGEQPDKVFNVGAIGIDNIVRLKLLSQREFESAVGFSLAKHNLLITFHPVTLEESTAKQQFAKLLSVLDGLKETHLFFTKANADTGGIIINKMIDEYVAANSSKAIARTSMGQLNYLSAMKYMDGVIGNSSSGLIEAPSFKIGTINIGDRQRGRIKADSIIDCQPSKDSIRDALQLLYSKDFENMLKTVTNPYGKGDAAKKIIDIIKSISLKGILKKEFYDVRAAV